MITPQTQLDNFLQRFVWHTLVGYCHARQINMHETGFGILNLCYNYTFLGYVLEISFNKCRLYSKHIAKILQKVVQLPPFMMMAAYIEYIDSLQYDHQLYQCLYCLQTPCLQSHLSYSLPSHPILFNRAKRCSLLVIQK